jgi:serine/threonine protein kinase
MNEIVLLNKYKIENILGKGKFGVVYKGSHLKTKKELAIKKEYNEIVVKILKHETTILNYLYTHGCKSIPQVYWFGLYNDSTYLVMTYFPCSLYDYISRGFSIKEEREDEREDEREREKNKWMIQMIDILEHIHKYFVLHRDIKPHNFMLDEKKDIYLIDFGLSTIYIDHENKHISMEDSREMIIGTPKYISYYIHEGVLPSRRDDLISLGYVFIFLWMGSLPWENISKEYIEFIEMNKKEYPEIHILHSKNQYYKSQKKRENLSLKGSPKIQKYMDSCYQLHFDTEPKYNILRHGIRL